MYSEKKKFNSAYTARHFMGSNFRDLVSGKVNKNYRESFIYFLFLFYTRDRLPKFSAQSWYPNLDNTRAERAGTTLGGWSFWGC